MNKLKTNLKFRYLIAYFLIINLSVYNIFSQNNKELEDYYITEKKFLETSLVNIESADITKFKDYLKILPREIKREIKKRLLESNKNIFNNIVNSGLDSIFLGAKFEKACVFLDSIIYCTDILDSVKYIIFGCEDSNAYIYNYKDLKNPIFMCKLVGHEKRIYNAKLLNSKFAITSSEDNTVRLWNIEDIKNPVQESVLRVHDFPVYTIALDHNKKYCLSGDIKGRIYKWNLENQTNYNILNLDSGILSIAISHDNQFLLIGTLKNSYLYALGTLGFPRPIKKIFDNKAVQRVGSVSFCSNNHKFLIAKNSDIDSNFSVWEYENKITNNLSNFTGPNSIINCALTTKDNRYIFTCANNYYLDIYKISDQKNLKIYLHTLGINCLAISDNNNYLVTGSNDKKAYICLMDKASIFQKIDIFSLVIFLNLYNFGNFGLLNTKLNNFLDTKIKKLAGNIFTEELAQKRILNSYLDINTINLIFGYLNSI